MAKTKGNLNSYLRYTGLGIQFVVIFTLFVMGGLWIDRQMGSEVPWLMLLGAFLGGTLATYQLYREVIRDADGPSSSDGASSNDAKSNSNGDPGS